MKFLFITVCAPAVQHLCQLDQEMQQANSSIKLYYAAEEFSPEKIARMIQDMAEADCILVDLMGAPPTIIQAVEQGLAHAPGQILPYGASARSYLRLGKFTAEGMKQKSSAKAPSMEAMKKMQKMAKAVGKVLPGKMRDMRNYVLLMQYFQYESLDNLRSFLLLMRKEYGGEKNLKEPPAPIITKPLALYSLDDMSYTEDPDTYAVQEGFRQDLPTAALLFNAYAYPTDTSPCVKALADALSPFCNVLALGCSGTFSDYADQLKAYLNARAWKPASVILNCRPFRLGAGPMGGDSQQATDFLQEADVPYLHPFFLTRRTFEDWEESISGCSPSEILISVMLPEMDGIMDIVPVGAMELDAYEQAQDIQVYQLVPIPERIQHLADRVRRYLTLQTKPNAEKKLAILCYNYPPGEASLFGGAFLDTFASVSRILTRLVGEGYQTKALTAEELRQIFTAGKAVNSGKFDCSWPDMIHYASRHYRAPEEVTEVWGKAPGDIMVEDDDFLIPGVEIGNVFIGLQPARSQGPDQETSYHDKTIPPHHQYVAFYQWLREEFAADALIHVGTHGTLEFLKGKESALSKDCYPDQLIGDLPHIYLYYCGNPSEAIVAKRRSYAQIISYQPPVFRECSLYGEYLELSTEIDNYHQALSLSPQMAEDIRKKIASLAEKLNLSDDLDQLEEELYRMHTSLIPEGLHIFGQGLTDEEAQTYALGLLRTEREGIRPLAEILAAFPENACDPAELIKSFWETGVLPDLSVLPNPPDLPVGPGSDKATQAVFNPRKDLQKAFTWAKAAALPTQAPRELDGLIHALQGNYTPARLAGDIYRNPDVLPSGYNLYQFDSRLVPSSTAMERGRMICHNTLQAYREETGTWPASTAVILWGLETSQTQGETLGQILAYLGIRRVPSASIWNLQLEIIPLEELERPRIDVTVNICGFFRDMYPTLIEDLDDMLLQLYQLDEPDEMNFFRAHAKARYKKLLDQGYDPKEAEQLAIARIFGPKEGEYGTSLTGVIENKSWEDESELAVSFTDSLRYVYTRRKRGQEAKGLYEDNLKCVEIVSQLRSNHDYEITDLDHYYEFFGGLAKSVELAKGGVRAKQYITDTTGNKPITESANKAVARGIRTRVLNPQWIDGMLAHAYHGGTQIAQRFENVMGLAATTGDVDEWIYDALDETYVSDPEMRQRMIANNPHAYRQILEQLAEYHARGYWQATEEQLEEIREIYLDLENNLEESI